MHLSELDIPKSNLGPESNSRLRSKMAKFSDRLLGEREEPPRGNAVNKVIIIIINIIKKLTQLINLSVRYIRLITIDFQKRSDSNVVLTGIFFKSVSTYFHNLIAFHILTCDFTSYMQSSTLFF